MKLLSVNVTLINLMHSLLYFDCAETVMKIRSAPDAQNLIDLIDFLNNNEHFLGQYGPDATRKAARLGLEIFAKVPVLPRSLFLSSDVRPYHERSHKIHVEFEILCQSALMGRMLDHDYVVPLLWMQDIYWRLFVCSNVNEMSESSSEWRTRTKPSPGRRIQVMLKIAKAIQYFHSMGVTFHYTIGLNEIFLDSEFRPKFHFRGTTARYIRETPLDRHYLGSDDKICYSNESNISIFGCLLYEVQQHLTFHFLLLRNLVDVLRSRHIMARVFDRRVSIAEKPSEPEICEDAWQLIRRCCAEDPRSRPSIDEIVQETEALKMP